MIKPANILLDTNVWLDNYLGSRVGHGNARRLLSLAFELQIPLAYAVTSIKDVYYHIAKEFKSAQRQENGGILSEREAVAAEVAAWSCILNMSEIATAVGADMADIKVAAHMRGIHRDFEDGLIIAAVKRLGSDCLVTNDEKLLRHCPVAALDVPDMIDVLEQVEKNVEDFFDSRGPIYTTLNEAMS